MTDITFVPILEKIADKLPSVERYVVLTDKAHMPETHAEECGGLRGLDCAGRRQIQMEGL
ncbi:hypothetical protein BRDID11002_75830 [Bradyrhizobium diazoefficiens]